MRVGCDKILDSPLEEDRCGVCAGDGSGCRAELFTARAVATQSTSTTKLATLPRGARNIRQQQ